MLKRGLRAPSSPFPATILCNCEIARLWSKHASRLRCIWSPSGTITGSLGKFGSVHILTVMTP